jgi:hypothetical protein
MSVDAEDGSAAVVVVVVPRGMREVLRAVPA